MQQNESAPRPVTVKKAGLPQPPDAKKLQQYVHAATSDNTRKTYRSAIRQYERWGGFLPTDVSTLLRYLLDKAETLNPRTLNLHLTAIAQWHRTQRIHNPVDDPQIKKTIEGIRRTHGRPKQKATALRLNHIAAMVHYLQAQPLSLKQTRDLALVLVAFFGGLRRSELVGIQIEDLSWEEEGLLIQLHKSKTDQHGEGQVRALPFAQGGVCPCKALKAWILQAGLTSGALFRSINRWGHLKEGAMNPGAVNELLKRLAKASQLDVAPNLSSHSFRRGMSTSATQEGVDFELIKKQGGWKCDATVRGYIEEGQQLTNNAAHSLMAALELKLSEAT